MAQFKRWSNARSQIFNIARTPEQTVELSGARRGLDDYFTRAIDERRTRRGTDLISALVSAEEADDRLTQREIVITCDLLLIASNLTTTDLIGLISSTPRVREKGECVQNRLTAENNGPHSNAARDLGVSLPNPGGE